ncbi:4'-phosphopantetheinyl transferase family protein [Kribbella sp. NPDC004875]|uniref:4'-phosphopantetheinyl transferase family protein n=1 Tax=Kribbella sp. NPDC004875 TaxID=3364107 RepID=UPI0036A2DE2C
MGSPVYVWLATVQDAHELLLELAWTLVDNPALGHDESGRPEIPGLAVSVSRTHHLVAVAASYDGPLGIDLEERRPRRFAPLADRWFTATEVAWMRDQPDQLNAFLHLWTAKEALGKALGVGLRGLRQEVPIGGGKIESAPGLAVTYLPCTEGVLALAAPVGVRIEQRGPLGVIDS